jgi:hypothetical protein
MSDWELSVLTLFELATAVSAATLAIIVFAALNLVAFGFVFRSLRTMERGARVRALVRGTFARREDFSDREWRDWQRARAIQLLAFVVVALIFVFW